MIQYYSQIAILVIGFVLGLFTGKVVYARNYKQSGELVITETNDKTVFTLELDTDPNKLKRQDRVVFRVVKRGSLRVLSRDS
jgi:hypothetical protein